MATPHTDSRLVSLSSPGSFAAEQYQGLRLQLERLRQAHDVRVVAVTSPSAGDGKTVTSINLAGALGQSEQARVLLVDADLRRPGVSRLLQFEAGESGLTDAIDEPNASLANVTRRPPDGAFAVVLSGTPRRPPHELLRAPRFERLIDEARQQYDFVVLDTPPLVPVFDSALLARIVDGLLIVVAANRTPRRLLEEGLNLLDASKVLGIVFNRDDRSLSRRYGSSYRGYFRH
jgi:capsular exopolysaccharide synthesis family protein